MTPHRLLLAAAAAGMSFLAAGPARGEDDLVPQSFRVQDHGAVWQRVEEYNRRAAQGEWERAVEELQALLDLPFDANLVMRVPGSSPPRWISAAAQARGLFDLLPPDGRAAWEAAARERAERLLARGLRARRVEDLHAAARRFPARDVLRRAHDALANLALARGDFREAATELSDLLGVVDPPERPEVVARLAVAYAQAGDRAATERTARLAADIKDALVPGPGGHEPLSRFLERMIEASGPDVGAATGWPQYAGDATGTALADPPPRPERRAWDTPLLTLYRSGRENPDDGYSNQPSEHVPVAPAISRNMVFVNNGLSLVAADLASGRRLWHRSTRQGVAQWRDNPVATFGVSVEGDEVYAALATRADAPPNIDRTFYRRVIIYALPHRALHAVNRLSGELLWSHAREDIVARPDEAQVYEESVAGPPLVVGNDLLVATWKFNGAYEVRLVCYDRHTGATRWRTTLAHGQQELNLFGRPVKELASSALAERDGVVYLATGLGVAAAVSRDRGDVLWLAAYRQTDIPSPIQWWQTTDRRVSWLPGPTSVTADLVIVAPPDSPYLLAFDRATGETRWALESTRSPHYQWFLGVANGRAYVLGKSKLECLNLANGARIWHGDEQAGRLRVDRGPVLDAEGAGVLTGDRVFVPTDEGLLEIDALTGLGATLHALPADNRGLDSGNLTSADGALLLTSKARVDAYFDFEVQRRRLVERLAREPDDPRLRLEAGEIFRNAARDEPGGTLLDDSVACLTRGLELTRELSPGARERLEKPLRSSLFAALRQRSRARLAASDLHGALADLGSAVDVAGTPDDAARGLFDLADLAHKVGERRQAADALRRVAEELPDARVHSESDPPAHAGALARLRLGEMDAADGRRLEAAGRWLDLLESHPDGDLGTSNVQAAVNERLQALLADDGDAAVRDLVRSRAHAALDRARAQGGAEELTRVARLYPDPEIGAQAALAAADAHARDGRPWNVVQVLTALLRTPVEDRTKARALWKLAAAYRELGAVAHERAVLQRMVKECRGVQLTREDADAVARQALEDPRFRTADRGLPDLRVPLSLLWEADRNEPVIPQLQRVVGPEPEALRNRFLTTRSGTLELRDAKTGTVGWRIALPMEPRLAATADGMVAMVGDHARTREAAVTLEAYDLADGSTRWSRPIRGAYQAADANLGALHVLSVEESEATPVYVLTSVDLRTGGVVASREFRTPLRPQVTACSDAVLVYEFSRGDDGQPPRAIRVLDSATLAARGRIPLLGADTAAAAHPPGTQIAVTTDVASTGAAAADRIVAVDLGTGAQVWRAQLPGRGTAQVKRLHGFRGGVLVSDTADRISRLSVEDGSVLWTRDLSSVGNLVFDGEAVEDGLGILTLRPQGSGEARAVAISLDDGRELWNVGLGSSGSARPSLCTEVVAYEITDWSRRSQIRSSVLLLDRATGRALQTVLHPTMSEQYQTALLVGSHLVVTTPAALAVYGRTGE